MSNDIQPDPSMIGGVPEAPFVFLPEPVKLFTSRAARFSFLAQSNTLAPYLRFLADLSRLQARLCLSEPGPDTPEAAALARAKAAAMPLIDRAALARSPGLHQLLERLCSEAAGLEMPEAARLALQAVTAADAADRDWLLQNVLADTIPDDSAAPHLFVAAAVQIWLARIAAALDPAGMQKVGNAACPCCGGRPVSSLVTSAPGIENIRYAVCMSCGTRWNEVRIHCLCCGGNQGLSYRSAETTEATVKAECCRDCSSWVKIFYQEKNPSLDAVADDVGSIGLDMMMQSTSLKRGGYNPYMMGY